MTSSFVERQVESAIQDMFDDKAVRLVKRISKFAAKQGGQTALENYQLLGKRVLIVGGIVFVTVSVAASAISYVISRRSEDRRIEQIVHRVLEEERQKEAAEGKA